MWILYRFLILSMFILSLYLYFKVLFGCELEKRKKLLFVVGGTLLTSIFSILLWATPYRFVVNLIIKLFIAQSFFKIGWKKAVLGVGVYYIVIVLAEGIYFFTINALGLSLSFPSVNNIRNSFMPDITVLSILLLFIMGYSAMFRKKASRLDDMNLAAIYVGATILSIIIYWISVFNSVSAEQPIPLKMGMFIMSLLMFSILILFFTSRHLSIKKSENVRLIKDVETIKNLNQQLEAEIDERKKLEEQLQYYATTDTLTGVLNRRTGMLLLEKAMKEAKRNNQSVTICFVDVNFLKKINDTYGHNEGDELIVAVSYLLKEALRETDSICRLGGDEFLLILPDCTEEQAQEVSQRIERRIEHYNSTEKKPYKISLSYGFAEQSPGSDHSIDELLEIADIKMYQMKKQSRLA